MIIRTKNKFTSIDLRYCLHHLMLVFSVAHYFLLIYFHDLI